MMTAVNGRGVALSVSRNPLIHRTLNIVKRALSTPAKQPHTPQKGENDRPLIGRSAAMQEVYRTLARLMNTDLTVLINGESGTERLAAKALHDYGKRKNQNIAINMAAIRRTYRK